MQAMIWRQKRTDGRPKEDGVGVRGRLCAYRPTAQMLHGDPESDCENRGGGAPMCDGASFVPCPGQRTECTPQPSAI